MLKVVIIEDEQPAIENLLHELNSIEAHYQVAGILKTVEESITWFSEREAEIDLIFMDIQLADGLSFDIFKSVHIFIPVIFFTTAYDKYLQSSLEYNVIDYLLKPICNNKLRKSLIKFNNLKKHFTTNYQHSANALADNHTIFKDRIIVKKGVEFQSIKAEDVAFFYTEHKLIFLVDKEGKKYMAHANNLADLSAQLNKKIFFRANRKYIININFIKKYKSFERVKVEVELSIQTTEPVVISQENSSSFKNWIENL